MADGEPGDEDWDTCPGCGKRLGQPDSARLDENGDPVQTPTWHPECMAAHMGRPAGDGATVRMYDEPDIGPLAD